MSSDVRGHTAGDERTLRRFLIVDSHEWTRRSLSQIIGRHPGWCVVAEAPCALDGLRSAQENRPHVAIVDPQLREADGLEFTQSLVALAPDVRIVGYSFLDDSLSVGRFVAAGGQGFVSKYESSDALVDAIEQALAAPARAFRRHASMNEARQRELPSSL